MDHSPAADSSITTPTRPPRGVPVDAEFGRFSALTAPERELIAGFCRDSRPWALRQARRSYRHLPEGLREQAVERAFTELRTRTPPSLERRALAAELAERLTESLRHVHVGWCLNESSALLRREGTEPVQPEVRREELAGFVDEGLGGLERAVLQLEIGAGRDTRTTRAALRLHPRQYSQHRDAGMSKLRDAISAQVIGRACDQHVSNVVDAALGDRAAMDSLSAGARRCRFCAREAQGLRSVLHERLAVAPWPIAIKPAGLLAAKLGALGALFGGKGAGAGAGAAGVAAAGAGGSGATMAATVLAAAALATGTAAVVGHDATPRESAAGHQVRTTQSAAKPAVRAAAKSVASTGSAAGAKAAKRKASRAAKRDHRAARRKASRGTGGTDTSSTSSSAITTAAAPTTSSSSSSSGTVTTAAKPVTDALSNTSSQVTAKLPPTVGKPVQDTLDNVTNTVDDVTNAVDGLLKP
jgi:hypothetical protein